MITDPEKSSGGTPPEAADNPYGIEDVSVAPLVPDADDVESIYVAPNWKLVWWRFRKHRLAVFSTVIVICYRHCGNGAQFLQHASAQERVITTELFIPPQRLHFFDEGRPQLFVYAVEGVRNPETLRMEWETSERRKGLHTALCRGGIPMKSWA